MRSGKLLAVVLSLTAGALAALSLPQNADAAKAAAKDGAAESAANAFLASLPADLRAKSTFPIDSPERLAWHFVPKDRIGASLLELDGTQSELIGPLLATALSPEGLLEARGVMKHENILRRIETASGAPLASRRDPGKYHTAVFGSPTASTPWAWRFEGHHLSVNVTQLPGAPPIVAPLFIGANPAKVPSGAEAGFRLLAAEEDLGRELITMLSADKRKTALIKETAFADILTGNDPKVKPLALEGLAVTDMNAAERAQLRRLLELYVGRMTAATAQDALARIDHAGFEKVRFAWAGGLEVGAPHYYRIHGPSVLIEYDNTQNDANHIHTVYRDLERDLGGDALRAHYQRDAHPDPSKPYLSSR
jgi:hypothetical protein